MVNISLEKYLEERNAELEELKKEVGLLKSISVPVKVVVCGAGGFELYSEDYSLATDFNIGKRSTGLGGNSGYDGGYHSEMYETYPQFYFKARYGNFTKPIYTEHKGFENDSRVVIRSFTQTRGTGAYSSENGSNPNDVDLKKVFAFFRSKGVKENLLDRLDRRIKQAEEF